MDCRGVNIGDSKKDLFLTYYIYLISNIVIVNESKLIYNTVL